MAPPEGVYPPAFPPGPGAGYGAVGLKPARGGLLLGLGIASIVLSCGCIGLVLGIVTLVLANKDLAEMDAGTMDPAGRGNTTTARLLGIISLAMFAVATGRLHPLRGHGLN